jgi:hypothetical protein
MLSVAMLGVAGGGGGGAATPTTPNPSEPASGLDLRVAPGAARVASGSGRRSSSPPSVRRRTPIHDLGPSALLERSRGRDGRPDRPGAGVSLGTATITASLDFNGQTHTATAAIAVSAARG